MHHFFTLTLIGLFLSPISLLAQVSKEDSLRTQLSGNIQDTTRIQILNDLSWLLYQKGNYNEAKDLLHQVILSADATLHPQPNWSLQRKAMAHSIMGIINCSQGDYSEALENQLESLRLGKETGNSTSEANDYTNLGVISWYMGKFPEALQYYYEALRIYEESSDTTGIANIHNNIGAIHEYLTAYAMALKHYLISLDLRQSMKDTNGIAGAYNNIGNIYDYQKKYPESLENHFKALRFFELIEYKRGIAEVNSNIANTYSNMKLYAEEIKYRKTSLRIEEELGDKLGIATSYNNMGSTYYDQEKFQDALMYFDKGLVISKEIGALDRIVDSYGGLAEASAGMNQFYKAYEYHRAYSTMKDSLLNESSNNQIAEMKEKYESEKKDGQIELLHKGNDLLVESHRRRAIVRNFSISIFALLILLAFMRFRFLQKLGIEKIRNKISKDLHDDIGSTLSTISITSAVASRFTPEQHGEIVNTLNFIGESTRSAMENMGDIVWAINPSNDSFKKLLDRLQLYAYKILEARNIRLLVDIPETMYGARLSMQQRKNVYLILREGIQNVAKYSEATFCLLEGKMAKKRISLQISDNGIGFEEVSPSLGGNGLDNMKHRANELNAFFSIRSEKLKGTHISFEFANS